MVVAANARIPHHNHHGHPAQSKQPTRWRPLKQR